MPDLPDDALLLNNQFCFALYAASRKVIQSYGPLLKALDLTYTQYITLLVLWEHHILPVKDLGEYLMLDTGTLTPLLKKLEQKGLVTRTRSKADERSVLIELTPEGLALRKQALVLLPGLLCEATLGPDDLIDLRERLKGLVLNMQPCKSPE